MKRIVCGTAIFLATNLAFGKTETKEFATKGLSTLVLENMKGKVTVSKGKTGTVQVTTTKRAFDGCSLEMGPKDKKLVLKTTKNDPKSTTPCEVDFSILASDDLTLDLKPGDGDLDIEGTPKKTLKFKVGTGNVSLRGKSALVLGHMASGKFTFAGTVKEIILKLAKGDVDAVFDEPPKGEAEFFVDEGNTAVVFKSLGKTDELEVFTKTGNIDIRLPSNAKIRPLLASKNGNVVNELGKADKGAFTVEAKTDKGDISVKKLN